MALTLHAPIQIENGEWKAELKVESGELKVEN
jgi:hypothetical protein